MMRNPTACLSKVQTKMGNVNGTENKDCNANGTAKNSTIQMRLLQY